MTENQSKESEQEKVLSDIEDEDDGDEISASIEDILPPEILESLPEKEKRRVVSSLSIMAMQGSSLQRSSIAKQLKPEHISQIIQNSEKDSQREFEKNKISENTKRLGMGAILSLIIIVFVYAGTTKDKDLSEKVVLAGISALGGFGAGFAIAKKDQ
jgi:hypothetical protein